MIPGTPMPSPVADAALPTPRMPDVIAEPRRRARTLSPVRRVRPVVLLILDGFGVPRGRPRTTRSRNARDAALDRGCSPPARTRRSTPPSCASGCRRARWATPRSATSTSAPGASSTRTSRASTIAIATGEFARNPVLADAVATRARRAARRCTCWASCRPAACTATSGRSPRWSTLAAAGGVTRDRRARLPRRPRHAAAQRRRVARDSWQASAPAIPARASPRSCGRYYAMDRDQRWERVAPAYELLVDGRAPLSAPIAGRGARAAYARGENDEFVQPTAIVDAGRRATADGTTATSSCS